MGDFDDWFREVSTPIRAGLGLAKKASKSKTLKAGLKQGARQGLLKTNDPAKAAGIQLGIKTALGARTNSSKPNRDSNALPAGTGAGFGSSGGSFGDPQSELEFEDSGNSEMEDLLAALQEEYSGTMPGFDDSQAIAALDAALGNTLTGIQGLRDKTNENYKLSDSNLSSMHNAYKGDIETNGARNYNNISDSLVNSLTQGTNQATAQLTQMEDESQAKRTAMLRSLGIEEAAAAPASTVIDEAKANLTSRNATDLTAAQEQRATNQSYNTGMAQSVGAAGVERRSELQRQLNDAMGTIDAKEMDARTQYQNQKAGLASQKAGAQNDLASFEYGMYQDKQDGLRGMLDSYAQGGESAEPVKTSGYAGLAQDLINSGIDEQSASQAMQAHADVIGSEDYLKARQRGQDPVAYTVGQLTKKGIPVSVALQIATNYNNLGSTSSYAAMQ